MNRKSNLVYRNFQFFLLILLLGDGKVSMSISESSSSLNRRVDEFVLFDSTGVDDDDDDGGGLISTEGCRTAGISGRKALDD